MKKLTKKIWAVALAVVMVLAMTVTAMAQTVETASTGQGSITISNAAKDETYSIYKLFDATITEANDNPSIAYTGTIPEGLNAYFEQDIVGNISAKKTEVTTEMSEALKAWAATATETATATADGSELVFVGLPYGYYVITTTQGNSAISVDSTNPNVTVIDKNTTPPLTGLKKDVDNVDVHFGQQVTYTVTFSTANYDGDDQIVSYTIKDTLPEFLSNVTVTGIKIAGTNYLVEDKVPQFDENKEITIPWVEKGNNIYKNGATIEITYTAVVTEKATVAGATNKNEVTVTYETLSGKTDKKETSKEISTYAIALKKVDQNGKALAGATFQFPFYVKSTVDSDGTYIYAGTVEAEGLTNEITTPDNGEITIKGVASGTYDITETKAPNGYNKLTEKVTVEAETLKTVKTEKTFYLDENGNVTDETSNTTVIYTNNNLAASAVVVVNKTGAELPSTGGIGTTMFYVIGAILVLGAGVLLVTRRRMSAK